MLVDLERLDDIIKNLTDPELFSGVVSVRRGDEVLFEKSYGYAIRSEFIPNKPNTKFQMASGCKVFTSVAICQLVERGKLKFDTLLSDCVDVTFPNYAPDITISHLLTHSAGITSYYEEDVNPDYEDLWGDLPVYKVRGPRDFLPLFQHKNMKFSPGKRFEYNDGGFILLGLVIESTTGVNFSTYVRQKIFEPTNMLDSGYFATDQLPERTAYAYIKNTDGTWRTNFFAVPVIGGADGGAYTTVLDMARFWGALTGKKLLNTELTASLLDTQIATSLKPPYGHYGFGVWIDRVEDGNRKIFVEGLDPGVALRSAVYVDEGLVVTVLGNTSKALWPLYRKIEKILEL